MRQAAAAVGGSRRWPLRSFLPVLVPAALGLVFAAMGRTHRAAYLLVGSAIVLVVILLGVPVERYVTRFAVVVAHWLGVIATGVAGIVLITGGWLARLFRRDPLVPRRARGPHWQPAASAASSRALAALPYGVEPSRAGRADETAGGFRAMGRSALLAIGSIALILTADLAIGVAWEKWFDSAPDAPAAVVDAVNFTGNTETFEDVRASHPAMAAYPWADAYFRETQLTPSTYWPFTESRPLGFEGEFINIEGWSRRSYIPDDLPDDAPVVWVFGGSTTWGEGQRDEYTIASYLARIAEREGSPIRVVNYGQRGWTHFQEMILFEQLLAEGPPPQAAIFYDGANEINAQTLGVRGVPTHTLAAQYAELISGGIADEVRTVAEPEEPNPAREIWTTYLEHSALRRAVGSLRDQFDPPAGASTAQASDPPVDDEAEDIGQNYVKTVDDARAAVEVYERGRELTQHLAREYDVEPHFFWQPVVAGEAERWANRNMSAPTIDISDALDDHFGVYIDGGHTNEEGARLVAERIWSEIGADLAALEGEGNATPPSGTAATSTTTTAPTTSTTPRALPDSPEALLDLATAELDQRSANPCQLNSWLPWMGEMRATTPAEVARSVALAQRYFGLLIDSAGPAEQDEARRLREISDQLPMLVSASPDPNQPLFVRFADPATSPVPDAAYVTTFLAEARADAPDCR